MLVFKNVASETTSITQQLTIFGKTFADIKKDLRNGLGIKSFSSVVTSSIIVKRQANELIGLNKQLRALQTQYSQGKIEQSEYRTQVQATQERIAALTTQTETLTLKQRLLAGVTQTVATAFNMLKMAAVTFAVTGIIALVSKFVNHLSEVSNNVEKTKEKVKSLTDEFNTAISTANENAKRIEELIADYDKLSKGVNNLGENISLTNEEYDEYKSLTNEIADMFPNLIQGYDNEGNAVLTLKGNVEQLRDAYKEAQQEAYNLLIATGKDGDGNDIIKQWQDTQETNFWAKLFGGDEVGKDISTSEALKLLKTFDKMDFSRFKELPTLTSGAIEETDRLKSLTDDELDLAYSDFIRKTLGITDWNISEEDFTNAKKQANALIQTYNAEIESSLSGTRSLANAYLNRNENFDKLDESSQNAASVIVNSLDANIANQLTTMTAFSTFTDNIVNAFDNSDVREAANKLFTLDTSSMSVGEINSEIDKYINIIADAIDEDSDALKIRLGFDETDNLLERAKKTFDMQANAGMKGLQDDINKFLEKLTPDDLKLAMENIPDLFADGLDGASKKIQEFKADPNNSIAPSFDYSTYSEQVDTVVKNLDKVQSAIDKLNEGKGIDGKDITELANTFPEYSSKILSASDNTEKLKAVLKDIKSDTPKSLINTLTNLKDLSEQDQEAVNGLITILSKFGGASASYSDMLAELETRESMLSTAYKEMHDDGVLSIATYQKLAESGIDYSDAISIVNGKITANIQSLKELTKEKYQNEIATLRLKKAEIGWNIAANPEKYSEYAEQIRVVNEELANLEGITNLYDAFDYTTTAKKDKDEKPERVLAFEEELAKREHEINMGLREEDDAYYDWLLSAAHTAYDGLKDYQDELWKHEETVYKWRKDKEQELFDEKIENMKTLADKALDSNTVFGDLTRFEYARNQITGAISEIQKRINDIQEGRLAGNADDIKALNDELTDLRETLADINKDELEYELDNEKAYWEDLKSKQEDIYDKEIDKLEKVKDAISKKNEEEEKATDLAEKQLSLEKAKLELEKARQNRSVMLVTKQGTFYTADQSAIDEAEKNVKDAEKDIADAKKDDVTDKISEQIDVLKEQKENTQNYYDTIIKLLEDSQNDPLQAEANRDLWGKILATENGQNAIANADQDQVSKLIENGFLALNDGKYSLNNPDAEVPKDSQTITKSDITDVLTTVFGKKEGYTPEKIASIAEKFEEKTHLLYDGFTPSDVVNKATENVSKTINNSQVINKVQNMNTTYHIDKIEVGYSGNDFEGLLADTIDAINQGIIVNRNKILHGR